MKQRLLQFNHCHGNGNLWNRGSDLSTSATLMDILKWKRGFGHSQIVKFIPVRQMALANKFQILRKKWIQGVKVLSPINYGRGIQIIETGLWSLVLCYTYSNPWNSGSSHSRSSTITAINELEDLIIQPRDTLLAIFEIEALVIPGLQT